MADMATVLHDEKIKLRGRLAEAEQRFAQLDISCDADIMFLRKTIDPFEDVTKIDVDAAKEAMDRLWANVKALRETNDLIRQLKAALDQ